MRAIDLSSKDAYLQWVSEWKSEYANVSLHIRTLKRILTKPHEVEMNVTSWGTFYYSKAAPVQSQKAELSLQARQLLKMRATGKTKSIACKYPVAVGN